MPSIIVKRYAVWLVFSFIVAAAGVMFFIRRRTGVGRHGFVSGKYLELKRLVKAGRAVPGVMPGDIARMVAGSGIEQEVGEFLRLYEEHRFGGRAMGLAERKRYASLLKEITHQFRRSPV